MTSNCLINGQATAQLSPLDRGLAYGDGVFRTIRVVNAIPVDWELHYSKLQHDCTALSIACPDANDLLDDVKNLAQEHHSLVMKVIVTRGQGQRGYAINPGLPPTRIVISSPMPAYPEENFQRGVKLHLCNLRLSRQPALAGIKHLNRLENVLGRAEWQDSSVAEGILLDENGNAIEGTMSNIFARFGEELATPDLSECGVSGVTRDRILQLANKIGLNACVRAIPLHELMQADEIIICNSLISVWQVNEFNGKQWSSIGIAKGLREQLWK